MSWSEVSVSQVTDHHGWKIIGQSVAATRTCLVVPFLDLAFDCGFAPSVIMSQPMVCISHGHADHLAALARHVFDRMMHEQTPPTYLMPIEMVGGWHQSLEAQARLNWSEYRPTKKMPRPYRAVGIPTSQLSIGQPVIPQRGELTSVQQEQLQTNGHFVQWLEKGKGNLYFITSYRMDHTVPTIGFLIWEVKKKLAATYQHLTSQEIGQLVKEHKQAGDRDFSVVDHYQIPRLGYTGDTTIRGVLQNPDLLLAETLIIECTYLQEEDKKEDNNKANVSTGRVQAEGRERGHIHEADLVEHQARFRNRELVLCHFSAQYRKADILSAQQRLQQVFGSRLKVTMFV